VLRALAVLLGLFASLLVIEAGMWLLHFCYRPAARDISRLAPAPGERRIACFGDSNTYGIHLDVSASFPQRLQRFLDLAPGQPWRVINLGYPGQNTAQIRARLAENLDAYRPEIVIVWAGANNTWSPAMRHLWDLPDGESASGFFEALVQKSRLFKSARMLASRTRTGVPNANPKIPGGVPGLDGADRGEGLGQVEYSDSSLSQSFSDEQVQESIAIDLGRILALCRERGAALVLADYPIDIPRFDGLINAPIRAFASGRGVPLIRMYERALPELESVGLARTMFGDRHATALGNFVVAGEVLATLLESRLLETRAEWSRVPNAREITQRIELAVVSRSAEALRCELFAPPQAPFAISLLPLWIAPDSSAPSSAAELGQRGRSSLLERCRAAGRLDGTGYVLVEIPLPSDRAALQASGPEGAVLWGWRLRARATRASGPQKSSKPAARIDVPLEVVASIAPVRD